MAPVPFNATFLCDEDIFTEHPHQRPSSQMHHWKRLLPSQVARINGNDNLLFVVPPIDQKTSFHVKSALQDTMNAFDSVIGRSSSGLYGSARSEKIEHMKRRHVITRERETCHKFSVRVRNYPERIVFESHNPTESAIDSLWNHGAGINVLVCGYSKHSTALIKMKKHPLPRGVSTNV